MHEDEGADCISEIEGAFRYARRSNHPRQLANSGLYTRRGRPTVEYSIDSEAGFRRSVQSHLYHTFFGFKPTSSGAFMAFTTATRLATVLFVGFSFFCAVDSDADDSLPNIVYILADDLGTGDVSSFNERSKISTPNIDRIAAAGMRFTDAHSGSGICTPTRYGILTGRYSWRTWLQRGVVWGYGRHLIEPERLTVASLLQAPRV